MRSIIIILLLSPFFGIAQKNDVLIRLTDSKGQLIKGESVLKGFENWLAATSLNTAGKNNTQLNFTMTVTGASADLKKALANGELLLNGQVSVITPNLADGRPLTSYTIKMENIAVVTCFEAIGCNNGLNTTVTLQAKRIGWTYYDQSKTGITTVSRKFGWDAENNKEWTAF